MDRFEETKQLFRELNSVSSAGGAVFLSTGRLAELPITELANDYLIDIPVYNRSLPHLKIDDAMNLLEECVFALQPRKVCIALGEEDLRSEDFQMETFMEKYAWLLYTLHNRIHGRLYVISLPGKDAITLQVNQRLAQLAADTGCQFLDVSSVFSSEHPALRLFGMLSSVIREHAPTFCEAMRIPVR